MMPAATPNTKPSTASLNVTQICSQIEPYSVPCCTQSFSCLTIPLGWPQKNGSTIFALVSSCQPPMMITSVAMRARPDPHTAAAGAAADVGGDGGLLRRGQVADRDRLRTAVDRYGAHDCPPCALAAVAVRAYARSTSSRSDSQIWWCSSRKRGSNRISCTAPRGRGRSMS